MSIVTGNPRDCFLFLRLEVERQDQINSPVQSPSKSKKEQTPTLTDSPGVEKFNIKGAVPGTTIPGQRVSRSLFVSYHLATYFLNGFQVFCHMNIVFLRL